MTSCADALALADAGWAVIPLNGKVPRTAHGVKDASRDPVQIARWWPQGSAHNIGARVPGVLVVLDIDPQNGGTLDALAAAAGGQLPATLTVHSGRGTGGRHLYFLNPGGPLSSVKLPDGIDVKTERGYCVMPPSLHPATGLAYRWEHHPPAHLPAQLLRVLRPDPPRPPKPRAPGRPLATRALHLVAYVQDAPEGTRNDRLFWAVCQAARDGHDATVVDLLEGAAIVAGLSEREARRTIASAQRTAGTVS